MLGSSARDGSAKFARRHVPTIRSVESVHIAEIDPAKLARVGEETRAKTATTDYRELLRRDDIDAMFVCSTPETTHYPITKDCL